MKTQFIISNVNYDDWFLYSVEDCKFGKRMEWTKDIELALKFDTSDKVESFIELVVEDIPVNIKEIQV